MLNKANWSKSYSGYQPVYSSVYGDFDVLKK